jgi:bifunctional NMN adenylyltransferase/nudix hydrolase
MRYKTIVLIGRFQPPHLAHIQIMKQALQQADQLLVLCGSANQPRTIKNPWTVLEREEMIRASLPQSLLDRLIVLPLHDKTYNDQLWATQVQDIVTTVAGEKDIGVIGYTKDESSYYLDMFPQWDMIDTGNIDDIHATDIRSEYFTSTTEDDFDLKIGRNLPTGIHDFLQAFMMREEYGNLVAEYKFLAKYKSAWDTAPYAPTFVTVDAIVIQSGHVLLIRRRANPGKHLYAIPGGFLDGQERIEDAVIRELREETKIKVPTPVLKGSIKSRQVFDHPDRSLRGRTITHAFLIELPPGELPKIKGSDDADKAKWVPLSVFNQMEDQMFEDHYHIIQHFLGEV